MNSSQEIAEEIITQFIETEAFRYNLCVNDLPFLKSLIATAINKAREEAKRDAIIELCEGEDCFVANRMLESHAKGYREGHNEAIERAAEIADEHNGCVDIKCLRESNCGASIAQAIRSEAEKV